MLALCICLWGELVLGHYTPRSQQRRRPCFPSTLTGYSTRAGKLSAACRAVTAPKLVEYELLSQAEHMIIAQGHACACSAARCAVYRRCCSTCTSVLRSAASPSGSPRMSASRARSSCESEGAALASLRRTSRSTLRTSPWGIPCARRSSAIRSGSARYSACRSTGATLRAVSFPA